MVVQDQDQELLNWQVSSRAALRSLSSRNKPDNSTQTKLLLFWRKPARKCWWSHDWVTIEIDAPELFKSMKM